jgi:hypothetical protein
MQINAVPHFDDSDNTTGCCARFNPEGWEGQTLHFEDKPFIHAKTRSAMHIPLNMGHVFARVQTAIEDADAYDPDNMLVLSYESSPWSADHYFASNKPVEGEEMTTLSGDFITSVFEGPYSDSKDWYTQMESTVQQKGGTPSDIYFFYTTCPKCAKAYGKNYVVGVARL